MSRKKIVVTGASGFLGSHLVERMRGDERYSVYALSSKPELIKHRLGGENIVYCHKDMLDADILKDSIVISCAYPRNSTGMDIADGLKYIQRVIEGAVENKATAIINVSSQSVYSQKRIEAATEETPICLESPYAVGKYAVELLLESICKGTDIYYTNLRLASLIGPGFDQRIVNRFIMKLMDGESITVMRQPKKMGFLDVEDAVNAIFAITNISADFWQTIYNVGNGMGYTVEEIYDTVAFELKDKIDFIKPSYENGTDMSSTEVSYERLRKDTGFAPTIDLNESVKRIIARMGT